MQRQAIVVSIGAEVFIWKVFTEDSPLPRAIKGEMSKTDRANRAEVTIRNTCYEVCDGKGNSRMPAGSFE